MPTDAASRLDPDRFSTPEVDLEQWDAMISRLIAAIMIGLIRLYQIAISPMLGPNCRFTPTCSQYAIEVLRKDGVIRGSWRTVRRILRCHPWNPGGYDPP